MYKVATHRPKQSLSVFFGVIVLIGMHANVRLDNVMLKPHFSSANVQFLSSIPKAAAGNPKNVCKLGLGLIFMVLFEAGDQIFRPVVCHAMSCTF